MVSDLGRCYSLNRQSRSTCGHRALHEQYSALWAVASWVHSWRSSLPNTDQHLKGAACIIPVHIAGARLGAISHSI